MSLESLPDEIIEKLVLTHRSLNDSHRRSFDGALGEVNVGGSAADLPNSLIMKVRQAIRDTTQFDDEMHRSGVVVVDGRQYQWTINRYTSKAKTQRCDGRMLGYRELMIGYPEDFVLPSN